MMYALCILHGSSLAAGRHI